MAHVYSDHYNSVASQSSPQDSYAPPSGLKGQDLQVIRGKITLTTTAPAEDDDMLFLFSLKSSARVYELLWGAQAVIDGGGVACSLGLFLTGVNHDGVTPAGVGSATLFQAAFNITTASDAGNKWLGNTSLRAHRGEQLWEVVNARNAGTFAEDPHVDFDFALKVTTFTGVTVAGDITLTAYYTEGY
jgi:hypothetical protein